MPSSTSPSLYDRLHQRAITSPFDDKKFVPLDVVEAAISLPSVAAEMGIPSGTFTQIIPSRRPSDLPGRVIAEAKKVFAILILTDKVAAIENLLNECLRDEHLPLSRTQDHEALVSCDGTSEFPFTGWRAASLDNFVEHAQWLFLAPVLDISGKVIKVHQLCPLPFISSSVMGNGAGGIVHRAEVHPAHQRGLKTETADLQVAIKQFHHKDDFVKENEVLQEIKHLQHRHIIRHLVSIDRGSRGYIIFPWADRGNLHEFWKSSKPETSWESALWSMKQMLGLATALHVLHTHFQCRHGDIKPDNILCLTERNQIVLKIADFGVSRIHLAQTIYRKSATTSVMLTPSYQGPEVEFENADEKVPRPRSRRYDIWSLGCVFLEFSIWLLHGPDAIETFARARGRYGTLKSNTSVPLYEVTDKGAKAAVVHQLVSWTIECLENDPRCKGETALADLLGMIKNRMLQPEVEKRAVAEEIGQQLEKIVNSAERNESYLFHPCNKSRIPPLNFDMFQPTLNH